MEAERETRRESALRWAFPRTVPVMVGYLVLGTAYGILMKVNGFGFWWAAAMSIFVYAGSLQYVGITFLASAVHPAYAFLMTLMLNARHLFYGISMLGKYSGIKAVKPYLIFGLTDETFSVVCGEEPPEGVDREKAYFWITFLDQLYWLAGSVLGVMLGSLIAFDTTGMDFALTALFVVIFVEQWESQRDHRPAIAGVAASVICLEVFGSDNFIIPAMTLILAAAGGLYFMETSREEKRNERRDG